MQLSDPGLSLGNFKISYLLLDEHVYFFIFHFSIIFYFSFSFLFLSFCYIERLFFLKHYFAYISYHRI